MRKYIIGLLIGVTLSFSATTYADDIKSLIGKTIQATFPIKINGQILDKPAIIIEGNSYVNVRSISNRLGLDVSFSAKSGIDLNGNIATVTESTYDITKVTQEINRQKRIIWAVEDAIKSSPSSESDTDIGRYTIYEQWKATLKRAKEELIIWEARKAALSQ